MRRQPWSTGDEARAAAVRERAKQLHGEATTAAIVATEDALIGSGEWDSLPSDFGIPGARADALAKVLREAMR